MSAAWTASARPDTLRSRRRAIARGLSGADALLFAGGERARNYPANTYPYRADSHFLFAAGAGIPDAIVHIGSEQDTLYLPTLGAEDALWHGEIVDPDTWRARTGVDRVAPISDLATSIDLTRVATLPVQDLRTRARQARLLGRPWADPEDTAQLTDVDATLADAVIDARSRHDEDALAALRCAARGTVAAHLVGMGATQVGRREFEVKAAMEGELASQGMTTSYQPIVTRDGHILHNNAYANVLAKDDLLLADVGAEWQGWAGDVTRTWPVSGRYTPTQRAVYEVVRAAQSAAIDAVRPGARYRDIHLATCLALARGLVDLGWLAGRAEDLVERGAHALFFPHGLGHLLGLDVHDMEDLGDRAWYAAGRTRSAQFGLCYLRLDRDLAPGFVVTIEPGLYVVPALLADRAHTEAFDRDGTLRRDALTRFADVRGIRIEDDVLCTDGAPEVLTASAPKDIAEVESLVGDEVACRGRVAALDDLHA